jgi:hypothetical protein
VWLDKDQVPGIAVWLVSGIEASKPHLGALEYSLPLHLYILSQWRWMGSQERNVKMVGAAFSGQAQT